MNNRKLQEIVYVWTLQKIIHKYAFSVEALLVWFLVFCFVEEGWFLAYSKEKQLLVVIASHA